MSRTTKGCLRVLGVALVAPLMLGQVCTPGGDQQSNVLVNKVVNVGGGGGYGSVSFNATAGQAIRITLTGAQASMEPYGNMENPDGSGFDAPPLSTASNGSNTGQVTLTQTGTYTLVIFDGSNAGGNVTVKVERL
jgi:hypothetical protein